MDRDYIRNGDSLEIMDEIPDESIDFILCDLPYGTTKNKWDIMINFEKLWNQYERIIKPHGCIALFAQSPFDKLLACSNLEHYRYEWIIEKTKGTGHLNAKKMPLKCHENILVFSKDENACQLQREEYMEENDDGEIISIQVFYKKLPAYNPQKTSGHNPVHSYTKHASDGTNYGKTRTGITGGGSTERYPRDVLRFQWDTQKSSLHPTQKPVALCEYMIRTYTNPGDIVLDNCMGSGTTCIAALRTGRSYIGIEKDDTYFQIAEERIRKEKEIYGKTD